MKFFETMKSIKLLFLALIITLGSCKTDSQQSVAQVPQEKGPINESEVTWNPDFDKALAEAKSLNQLLFVEAYSPTCPVCQTIEPFFKDPAVAKTYNTNFVNYKLDVGKQEQVIHINKRNIFLPSFPKFLFFNGDGELVHASDVVAGVESINEVAAAALDPNKRGSSFAKRFEDGERSIEFLAEQAAFARVAKDTATAIKAAEALFEIFPKNEINSLKSWKITKKCVVDLDNGFAKHWFNNYGQAKNFEEEEGHAGNQDNILGGIIQSSLFSEKGRNYSTAKLDQVEAMMKTANAGQYAESFLWEFRVKANIRENKLGKAISIGERMVQVYKDNGSAGVYITKVFTDLFPSDAYLNSARKWLNTSLPKLTQDSQKAEFYYESARVFQKAGDKPKAIAEAEKGIALANAASIPNAKWGSLIAELKQ